MKKQNQMEERMQKNNGITLIALVITIVLNAFAWS